MQANPHALVGMRATIRLPYKQTYPHSRVIYTPACRTARTHPRLTSETKCVVFYIHVVSIFFRECFFTCLSYIIWQISTHTEYAYAKFAIEYPQKGPSSQCVQGTPPVDVSLTQMVCSGSDALRMYNVQSVFGVAVAGVAVANLHDAHRPARFTDMSETIFKVCT